MPEILRDQINSARRQGYTDDQIVDYLKDKDPRVIQALSSGYSPTEITEYLAPPPTTLEKFKRGAGIVGRGLSETMVGPTAGALIGAPAGPGGAALGAVVGGLAVPIADVLTGGYNQLTDSNVRLPSQAISEMLPGPRAETPGERVLQTASGALGATGPSVTAGKLLMKSPGVSSGVHAVGEQLSQRPLAQLIAAPTSGAVGQTVTEATDNPFLGLAASVGTSGVIGGMRPVKREKVPTSEELLETAKKNYELLDKSGFQLDTNDFKTHMGSLPAKLRRDFGYVESVNPKVAGAFKELTSDSPKDIAEIQALRKVISSAVKSNDGSERMIASNLLDEFDDYVMNAPPSSIVSGNRTAIDAWKTARENYSRYKKSEIFSDIIENAVVSPGNKEGSLTRQLAALAKNKNRMRFFTPEEQNAIREAAKGGRLQSALRVVAKFKPMTPAAAIFTAVSPYGAYTAGAGIAADELAQLNRVRQLNQLGAQMRMGSQPKIVSTPLTDQSLFLSRGALNQLSPTLESRNNLRQ